LHVSFLVGLRTYEDPGRSKELYIEILQIVLKISVFIIALSVLSAVSINVAIC